MSYYFSYDAVIPEYLEKEGFYNKEELHCTLAYSKKDLLEGQIEQLHSLNIPNHKTGIITGVEIFNDYVVLLIDSDNLNEINKELIEKFSITEDHADRKMHVSIKKEIGNDLIDLKEIENEYVGREVFLINPKIFLKAINELNIKETKIMHLANHHKGLKP
jgi:hypothetical protein